jgi:hypothetical protein
VAASAAVVIYLGGRLRSSIMRPHLPHLPRHPWRKVAALGLCLAPFLTTARPGSPQAAAPTPTPDVDAFLARVESVWESRQLDQWIGLWDFQDASQRTREMEMARSDFSADETDLTYLRRPSAPDQAGRLTADVQVVVADEPRARVSYWYLQAERRGDSWALVSRRETGSLEGLVHLSLAPGAWRVHGASLRLEDFELAMEEGTLFTNASEIGPTALTFVGHGRVRFTPRPPAEREQLRQFSKHTELEREVGWAFLRINPADFARFVGSAGLEPVVSSGGRRRVEAEKVFHERAERSYLIDAPLPRSPWWLIPNTGDALVDFPWSRGHVLSFVVSTGEPEDLNLYDRDRHLQICSYPSGGRSADFSEDAGRSIDVLDHQLSVRFSPDSHELQATHVMRLRLLAPTSTLRLRLHNDFHISSVTAEGTARLLFFRVREQGAIVVSLGPLATREEPFTLAIRYSGRHGPSGLDQELLQIAAPAALSAPEDAFVEAPPLAYTNRTAWYPRPGDEDYAPLEAGFDTPEGWLAVTGGELAALRHDGGRVRSEFRLEQPGKYVTVFVGRLEEAGHSVDGPQSVRAFAGPRLRGSAQELLPQTQQVLSFYAGLFGPNPYPQLDLVLAEATTPGGHSPPGLVYLQQRPPLLRSHVLPADPANFSDFSDFFLAHEAAHQWWGQGTAPASYRERWLSEAWAQYCAAMWIRQQRGESDFYRMMDRMAEWAFRDDALGPIHLGYRLGHLKGDARIFRAIVYDKGAWVLHMLRGLLGDEAFFRGARDFLKTHRYEKAGTTDLREALERASGRDLSAYFERWIYDTGLPRLVWAWRTEALDAGYRTTVDVRPQVLPGPLPLQIVVTAGEERSVRVVTLDPKGGSWTFDTREKPREPELNGNRGLLAQLERVRRLPASY